MYVSTSTHLSPAETDKAVCVSCVTKENQPQPKTAHRHESARYCTHITHKDRTQNTNVLLNHTLRGRKAAASPPMDRVMAHEMTAYFIDRTVSLTKQCLGIAFITSRFVGKDFSWSASPFNPLSCTPSISIVTGDEEVSVTTGAGMATAMFSVRGRKAPLALVRAPRAAVVRAGAADMWENDEWVVKALVVPQVEQSATAEAVAAAVVFMLLLWD